MKIISVNVAQVEQISYRGRQVKTGIFKIPAMNPVRVTRLGLANDVQVDKAVHGGVDRAVYAYPIEHYAAWRTELRPGVLERFGYGAFGENLTIEGLLENEVCVGDELTIGSAKLMVQSPRIACFKLATKLGIADMPRRFGVSGRSGFYLRVVEEGAVKSGDEIVIASRADDAISVADFNRLLTTDPHEHKLLEAALATFDLPKDQRDYLVSTQGA
ncbi:MAG: MOSC domain-containing protein [Burkholderiales bacterium]